MYFLLHTVDSSDTPTPVDSNRNSTPSTQEASAEVKTRRKSDPAWGYCTQFTEGGKKKIKCMFCNDVFAGGGIHRFKEHLAKYPGNVAPYKKVDPEVEHAMFQNIEDWKEKKKKAQQDYEEWNAYGLEPREQDDVVEVSVANEPRAPSRRVAAAPAGNKGKRDLQLQLLVLASTSSLELAQGINQQLRVFFKGKQSRRRQICAWQDGSLMPLFHSMQVIPFFTNP